MLGRVPVFSPPLENPYFLEFAALYSLSYPLLYLLQYPQTKSVFFSSSPEILFYQRRWWTHKTWVESRTAFAFLAGASPTVLDLASHFPGWQSWVERNYKFPFGVATFLESPRDLHWHHLDLKSFTQPQSPFQILPLPSESSIQILLTPTLFRMENSLFFSARIPHQPHSSPR